MNWTVGEVIGKGFDLTKKNLGLFVGLLLVVAIINAAIGKVSQYNSLISAIGWLVGMIINAGVTKAALDVIDEKNPKFEVLFSQFSKAVEILIGSVVVGLIVLAGFILLIVPGIIWAIRYSMVINLIIDKDMKAMEAIKKSAEITKGNLGRLFVFGLSCFGVVLLGAIALGIGLFWAIPTVTIAGVIVYRRLLQQAPGVTAPAPVKPEPAK